MKGVSQDSRIYCIKAKNIKVFKKQWLPLIVGWVLVSLSILGTVIILMSYFSGFTQSKEVLELRGEIGVVTLAKALLRYFSFFIFGYVNLMYVSGVSSKTHKYVVYASYLILILFSLTIFYGISIGDFK